MCTIVAFHAAWSVDMAFACRLWPEGPLQPVGLACDDHHNSMVIAERFAVHEAGGRSGPT